LLLVLDDNSSMNFYGGELNTMNIYDNATAAFSGGRIDYLRSYQSILTPNQEIVKYIEMIVKNHSYNTSTKRLTGTWADDSAFSIQLVDQAGYDAAINNIKFTIVPEPATLGLGGLLLRRKQ
jgi:hypothetical protein